MEFRRGSSSGEGFGSGRYSGNKEASGAHAPASILEREIARLVAELRVAPDAGQASEGARDSASCAELRKEVRALRSAVGFLTTFMDEHNLGERAARELRAMRDCRADLYEHIGEDVDDSFAYSSEEYVEGDEDDEYEGPIAPKYYDWRETFPQLQPLVDNAEAIASEVRAVKSWTPWPEKNLYEGAHQNADWKVVPLLFTFPAFDETKMKWVDFNCKKCPTLTRILRTIPGVRTALLSIGPEHV